MSSGRQFRFQKGRESKRKNERKQGKKKERREQTHKQTKKERNKDRAINSEINKERRKKGRKKTRKQKRKKNRNVGDCAFFVHQEMIMLNCEVCFMFHYNVNATTLPLYGQLLFLRDFGGLPQLEKRLILRFIVCYEIDLHK
jgi:hypothetical protein